jgi:hypothetical protein
MKQLTEQEIRDRSAKGSVLRPNESVRVLLGEIDRLREALAWAEPRAARGIDHACKECGGSIPVEGFQCMAHKARALLAKQEAADGT